MTWEDRFDYAEKKYRQGSKHYPFWISEWINALAVLFGYRKAYLMEIPSLKEWHNSKKEIRHLQEVMEEGGLFCYKSSKPNLDPRLLYTKIAKPKGWTYDDAALAELLNYPDFPDYSNLDINRIAVNYDVGELSLLGYMLPTESEDPVQFSDSTEPTRRAENLDIFRKTLQKIRSEGFLKYVKPDHLFVKEVPILSLITVFEKLSKPNSTVPFPPVKERLLIGLEEFELNHMMDFVREVTETTFAKQRNLLHLMLLITEHYNSIPEEVMQQLDSSLQDLPTFHQLKERFNRVDRSRILNEVIVNFDSTSYRRNPELWTLLFALLEETSVLNSTVVYIQRQLF